MKAKIIDIIFYFFTIYFILTNFLLQIAIVPMCKYISLLRNVFPFDTALLKALYLATFEATKNERCRSGTWHRSMRN